MLKAIGRAANAIKIKTDGGSTRAVNCACCGGVCDPCTGVNLSNPLLATIRASTNVSVNFNFPAFTVPVVGIPIAAVTGSTGNLTWDGSSVYWNDFNDPNDPLVTLSIIGSCFVIAVSISQPTGRNVIVTPYDPSYPVGPTFPCSPTNPNDPYVQWQFFTANINGTAIKVWQRPTFISSIPPAYFPNAIISATFS